MNLISSLKKYARKRTQELEQLARTQVSLDTAEVNIAGQKLTLKLNVERAAAWKLYVELNTRIATQELHPSEGLLREALSSLYALFGITRQILKEAGPEVAQGNESLGFYAMEILNQVLRPVLAKWHPALTHWEAGRENDVSPLEHERKWKHQARLRRALESTRGSLLTYSEALRLLAGVHDLDQSTSRKTKKTALNRQGRNR